jgi:hypothetical protein
MKSPVLLFVATELRARRLQHDHDPDVVKVMPIGRYPAVRGSAAIVEMPPPHMVSTRVQQEEFDAFLEWLPTRLTPGEGKRITILG